MKKVLLIEDDLTLQDVYKLALEEFVDYTAVSTGKEGLEAIQTDAPDLVLLDVMLPGGVNGFDVLEQLKKDEKTKKFR